MAILKFNLAVPRRKKGETDFINCIAFSKVAELINQYFAKGNLIAIVGHIQTGSYDGKDGKKVYTTDVIVDEWDFTGEKRERAALKAMFQIAKNLKQGKMGFTLWTRAVKFVQIVTSL